MGALSLLFGDKTRARVGLVQFDASLTETHNKEVEVTDHPVEEGADITDHIRPVPESVDINGMVTNTPLVILASLRADSPLVGDATPIEDRAGLAYAELQRIMDDGELVTVVTSLREYENMVLTSMSVPRDVGNGNVLNANLSLREIIIAETERVAAPEPEATANKKSKAKGKQTTGPASEAQSAKSGSILSGLFGG